MAVPIPAIDRFTGLKTKRDALSTQLANLQGKLDSTRDHYNSIMRELNVYGIGSIDELRQKMSELNTQIEAGLTEVESVLQNMQTSLSVLDGNGK